MCVCVCVCVCLCEYVCVRVCVCLFGGKSFEGGGWIQGDGEMSGIVHVM